jgi:putative acyl-CoA dehydrogenase
MTTLEGDANQTPPFADINLFGSDVALTNAVARGGVSADAESLSRFGADWGSAHSFELGRLANDNPPALRTHDARGDRLDIIEFHPSWHELMTRSAGAGLRGSTWDGGSHVARAARLFMAYQVEAGHVCPITMTHAAMGALRVEPRLSETWSRKIIARGYDHSFKPWFEKSAVTLGMGMTERQGGTDVRTNLTTATPRGDNYEINGDKWFMSAPMCDAFLVLAQAPGGLTCFLMPRFKPSGEVNGLHFQRLKDKLGNRSNASSEVVFEHAHAERVGAEGAGVRAIINMVQLTRLDCAVASAGLMRFGLAYAVHHARHRRVFGKCLIEQPAMRAVLADLALESEAMTALVFRLARAFERAPGDPTEAYYARLMTPAIKYLVCKSAPAFLYEAMECLGGNGYVEELPLARAYREAPVNAIWEGSGNVMALDVLRAASRAPDDTTRLLEHLSEEAHAPGANIAAGLASNDAEGRARETTEGLARLGALAALREVDGDFADAYASTRLDGSARATYGARDLRAVEEKLLSRALAN